MPICIWKGIGIPYGLPAGMAGRPICMPTPIAIAIGACPKISCGWNCQRCSAWGM
jgi:hypothetical protein